MDIPSLAIGDDLSIKDSDLFFGPTEDLGEGSGRETFDPLNELKSGKGPNLFLYRCISGMYTYILCQN